MSEGHEIHKAVTIATEVGSLEVTVALRADGGAMGAAMEAGEAGTTEGGATSTIVATIIAGETEEVKTIRSQSILIPICTSQIFQKNGMIKNWPPFSLNLAPLKAQQSCIRIVTIANGLPL